MGKAGKKKAEKKGGIFDVPWMDELDSWMVDEP